MLLKKKKTKRKVTTSSSSSNNNKKKIRGSGGTGGGRGAGGSVLRCLLKTFLYAFLFSNAILLFWYSSGHRRHSLTLDHLPFFQFHNDHHHHPGDHTSSSRRRSDTTTTDQKQQQQQPDAYEGGVSARQALQKQQKPLANEVDDHDKDDDDDDRVVQTLREAGVSDEFLQTSRHNNVLPKWTNIVELYGEKPKIVGLETACPIFRETVPAVRRMLGAAGMFSTGTNLVTKLLKQNCYIPERLAKYGADATKEQLGMRWQVPWGKHTPANYKWKHATKQAQDINKHDILPVVTIRNPWRWMQSMCKNPYAAKWPHHHDICPHLMLNKHDYNEVIVKYGAATETYTSLAHLWNDWYHEYLDVAVTTNNNITTTTATKDDDDDEQSSSSKSSYPWIMIRMEDLIFHTKATITQVCHCAGGNLTSENFQYIVDSAKKDSPGHDTSIGIAEAWIKYSQILPAGAGFDISDYEAAIDVFDTSIMELFGYQHPPPPPPLLEEK